MVDQNDTHELAYNISFGEMWQQNIYLSVILTLYVQFLENSRRFFHLIIEKIILVSISFILFLISINMTLYQKQLIPSSFIFFEMNFFFKCIISLKSIIYVFECEFFVRFKFSYLQYSLILPNEWCNEYSVNLSFLNDSISMDFNKFQSKTTSTAFFFFNNIFVECQKTRFYFVRLTCKAMKEVVNYYIRLNYPTANF